MTWYTAWPTMLYNICSEMMESERLTGGRSRSVSAGGSVASASDASESMIKLIQSICTGVMGICCIITCNKGNDGLKARGMFLRDVLMLIVSTSYLLYILMDAHITTFECGLYVFMYVAYVAGDGVVYNAVDACERLPLDSYTTALELCDATHSKASLLVVARIPSSKPALARSALPVQTDVRYCTPLDWTRSQSSSV